MAYKLMENGPVSLLDHDCEPGRRFEFGELPIASRVHTIEALASLGYYAFAEPTHVSDLKAHALRFGSVHYDLFADDVLRSTYIDGESLIERGILPFLAESKGVFSRHGLDILPGEETRLRTPPFTYSIALNGTDYILWDATTLEHQLGGRYLATDRAIRVVNLLLESTGSEERLYWNYSFESLAVLLTEPLYNALLASGAIVPPVQ